MAIAQLKAAGRFLGWVLFSLALLLLIWVLYYASPIRTSLDSRWSIHTALSIMHGSWGDLADYVPVVAYSGFYAIQERATGIFTLFPVGVSILAMPFLAIAEWLNPAFNEQVRYTVPVELEGFIAAFYAALAGLLFFWVAQNRLRNATVALVATLIFCFCTSMWSTASRALWQHGPLVAAFLGAMLLLLQARERPYLAQFASLPLAIGFVIRPTASVAIAVLSLYVFLAHRRQAVRYVLWSLPVALPWMAYNMVVCGLPIPPYYLPARVADNPAFTDALWANLISPSRGLFTFSPILALCVPGFLMALRERNDRGLHLAFAVIAALLWVLASHFPQWWAGHSYGPRFMTDALPFLVYFIIFPLQGIARLGDMARAGLTGVVVVLASVSALIHFQGAFNWETYLWNVTPINIDANPGRVWDWKDPMFLRGLQRPLLPQKKILRPHPEAGAVAAAPYSWGAPIELTAGKPSTSYRDTGWYESEAEGTWTKGHAAGLFIALPALAGARDLDLVARFGTHTPAQNPLLAVQLLVNGQPLKEWAFSPDDAAVQERRIRIPAAMAGTSGLLALRFLIHNPVTPASLGISDNTRQLGLFVNEIRIVPAEGPAS
jgi:hypothetical protein